LTSTASIKNSANNLLNNDALVTSSKDHKNKGASIVYGCQSKIA